MEEPTPTEVDRMVFGLVDDVIEAAAAGRCSVRHEWSDDAGMWFTEVDPANPAAAKFSVAWDRWHLLTVTVGRTWFEIYPVSATRTKRLDDLREVLEAVVAGQVEESPGRGGWAAKIGTSPGKDGAVQWPWPRKPRPVHKYEAY